METALQATMKEAHASPSIADIQIQGRAEAAAAAAELGELATWGLSGSISQFNHKLALFYMVDFLCIAPSPLIQVDGFSPSSHIIE